MHVVKVKPTNWLFREGVSTHESARLSSHDTAYAFLRRPSYLGDEKQSIALSRHSIKHVQRVCCIHAHIHNYQLNGHESRSGVCPS